MNHWSQILVPAGIMDRELREVNWEWSVVEVKGDGQSRLEFAMRWNYHQGWSRAGMVVEYTVSSFSKLNTSSITFLFLLYND